MKYYSEILKTTFETEKECLQAEKEHKEKIEKQVKEQEIKQANITKRKKELSKVVEEADVKVNEANKLYELARERAKEILEKSNKEIKEILDAAQAEVKKANKEKLDAILAFNKEFGTYKVTYSGDKAITEFNKSMLGLDNYFKDFLKFLF